MRSLKRWFQRERVRQQRAVYLEDALLSGRFAAYAVFRLRYFLGRSLVEATLHIIEFAFLAFIFSHRTLVAALLVRTAAGFLNSCWWGALESMRAELRGLHREGRKHLMVARLPPAMTNPEKIGIAGPTRHIRPGNSCTTRRLS